MSTASTSLWNVSTPALGQNIVSVANGNLDGTGAAAQIVAAGSNGTRIDWIHMQAIGPTTAGMIRLFLGDVNGPRALLAEFIVQAITPGASVKAWSADYFPSQPTQNQPSPLNLMQGVGGNVSAIWATTANNESFRISAFGANY